VPSGSFQTQNTIARFLPAGVWQPGADDSPQSTSITGGYAPVKFEPTVGSLFKPPPLRQLPPAPTIASFAHSTISTTTTTNEHNFSQARHDLNLRRDEPPPNAIGTTRPAFLNHPQPTVSKTAMVRCRLTAVSWANS